MSLWKEIRTIARVATQSRNYSIYVYVNEHNNFYYLRGLFAFIWNRFFFLEKKNLMNVVFHIVVCLALLTLNSSLNFVKQNRHFQSKYFKKKKQKNSLSRKKSAIKKICIYRSYLLHDVAMIIIVINIIHYFSLFRIHDVWIPFLVMKIYWRKYIGYWI